MGSLVLSLKYLPLVNNIPNHIDEIDSSGKKRIDYGKTVEALALRPIVLYNLC